jgi:hypothetical protein
MVGTICRGSAQQPNPPPTNNNYAIINNPGFGNQGNGNQGSVNQV